MTDIFDFILPIILRHEGGFVNNPADPGGATNYGITLNTYSNYLGRTATVDEVRHMPIEHAKEIYRKTYYDANRVAEFNDELQPLLFDMIVNQGARGAFRLLQREINEQGFGPISQDGIAGPITRARVKTVVETQGAKRFLNELVDERIEFYQDLANTHPSMKQFLRGWKIRAESFRPKST